MTLASPAGRRLVVVVVGGIMLVESGFYSIAAPLLPHLKEDIGLSDGAAGLLLALHGVGTLVAALPAGVLAARLGPKVVALAGLAVLAASSLLFGVGHTAALLDLARLAQGVGGALAAGGALAWLASSVPAAQRGEALGLALGLGLAGNLLGPVLGTVATQIGPPVVFGALTVVTLAFAAWAARLPGTRAAPGAPLTLWDIARRPGMATGVWLVALPAGAFGVLNVCVPLLMDGFGASHLAVGAAFLGGAIAEAGINPPAGRLSDRRGPGLPIAGGLAATAVVMALLAVAHTPLATALLLVAASAALGAFWAPSMAGLSTTVEALGVSQGLAFGFVNLGWAAGSAVGSALGGVAFGAVGHGAPFLTVVALALVTLALRPRPPRPSLSAA